MTGLFAVLGAVFGACQFFLTACAVKQLLARDRSALKIAVFTAVKLALYAAAIALVMTVLGSRIISVGVGFGIGMLVSAGIVLIIESRRK